MSAENQKIHFVTLGCPKNRVDSEIMLGHLQEKFMEFTPDAEAADVIVVNTCGFIEDAKQESIDMILGMARYKTEGNAKQLIVTGCLAQRYGEALHQEIPEIDVLLGNGSYTEVAEHVAKNSQTGARVLDVREPENPSFLHHATTPRINTFRPHSAYVKISEGCDQQCTFCIIPKLRGLQRSRTIEDVVAEVHALGERGVVEINLVAQDLTGYGTDLSPTRDLAQLLWALGKVDTVSWIRLHYAYPRHFSKDLLASISDQPRILPYIDMPLQHIADPLLKAMRRGKPRRYVEALLDKLRSHIPDLTLRSSFIVGFPGETDAHYRELCGFISEQPFERVGVFKFSREEGTPSHDLPNQVPREVIDDRHHNLMLLLKEKSRQRMAEYLGQEIEVIVDGPSEESELLLAARHKGQAPEIDGTTYIGEAEVQARSGDIVEVEIVDTADYDLVAKLRRIVAKAPDRPDHARMDVTAIHHHSRKSLPVLGA